MHSPTITNRKPTKEQLDILLLLYKFRFGTTTLLSKSLGLNSYIYVNQRLKLLLKQGYLGRNYDTSYKLKGKPATYYLLSKGIKELRKQDDISTDTLKRIYNDKKASKQFITHNLAVYSIHSSLHDIYNAQSERMIFYTKSNLSFKAYDYLPATLPDAYIAFKRSDKPRARSIHMFLDVFESSRPISVMIAIIGSHIDYYQAGTWEKETGTKLVSLIVVCDTPTLQKRLRKHTNKLLSDKNMEGKMHIYVTTSDLFLSAADPEDDILMSLRDL